ncbi:MAG: ABC transporter permease [Eubacteriales bacterium]
MKNVIRLTLGELKRLVAYKILPISLVTGLIWIIIFLFISKEDASHIAPLLIFVDICMMSILLIGASHHLEKQEGTINSMMIMPVSLGDILFAKVVSSLFLGLESAVVISAALFFIHGVTFNYGWLLLFVIIAGAAHTAIGFFLSLISKDFTSMLGLMMAYMLPFTIPTILFAFGIINAKYEWLLMISPSQSAAELFSFAVSGEMETAKMIFACIYLVILSVILYRFVVLPRFKNNAVRGY